MDHVLLGLLACAFFILSCSYSLFKRSKSIRSNLNLHIKDLLNYHCIFSLIAIVLVFLHAGSNLSNIRFSTGYISLLLMILVTAIGILMKYLKKAYMKHKTFWLYSHILLAILLFGTILLHIFSYLLLE